MIVKKITHGYVIQTYDTDVNGFINQDFVVGDDCIYENQIGEELHVSDLPEEVQNAYLPYRMIQPDETII